MLLPNQLVDHQISWFWVRNFWKLISINTNITIYRKLQHQCSTSITTNQHGMLFRTWSLPYSWQIVFFLSRFALLRKTLVMKNDKEEGLVIILQAWFVIVALTRITNRELIAGLHSSKFIRIKSCYKLDLVFLHFHPLLSQLFCSIQYISINYLTVIVAWQIRKQQ